MVLGPKRAHEVMVKNRHPIALGFSNTLHIQERFRGNRVIAIVYNMVPNLLKESSVSISIFFLLIFFVNANEYTRPFRRVVDSLNTMYSY